MQNRGDSEESVFGTETMEPVLENFQNKYFFFEFLFFIQTSKFLSYSIWKNALKKHKLSNVSSFIRERILLQM